MDKRTQIINSKQPNNEDVTIRVGEKGIKRIFTMKHPRQQKSSLILALGNMATLLGYITRRMNQSNT